MFRNGLRFGVVACGVLAVALHGASGQGKDDKPSGAWGKKDGEVKLAFADGVLKVAPHGDPAVILIVCDYTVEKGVVKAKVTGLEGKEEVKKKAQGVVPVGLKFEFRWKPAGDAAKLEDLTGENVEPLKAHLEGDFEAKK